MIIYIINKKIICVFKGIEYRSKIGMCIVINIPSKLKDIIKQKFLNIFNWARTLYRIHYLLNQIDSFWDLNCSVVNLLTEIDLPNLSYVLWGVANILINLLTMIFQYGTGIFGILIGG